MTAKAKAKPVDLEGPDSVEPIHKRRSVVDPRRATGRLLWAALLGVAATWLGPSHIDLSTRAVLGWDVAALVLIMLGWNIILRADAKQTEARASAEDPGGTMVFLIAISSSLFSLFAAANVLRCVRAWPGLEGQVWMVLSLLAPALSWVLTHTAFTLRYAHLYYRRAGCGGLEFPGSRRPADVDFAYFAFTLGMCFQTSDVVVSSSRIRRAVLFHALLSFLYNTTILALALNLVFSVFQ